MKIRASFLLFVFLLNNAVGLNCALRSCDDCKDEIANYHQKPVTSVDKNDPCCQGAVNSFMSLAKLVPQAVKLFIPIPTVLIRSYDLATLNLIPFVQFTHCTPVDERQRPPTPDIRIIIQSFQV